MERRAFVAGSLGLLAAPLAETQRVARIPFFGSHRRQPDPLS
jgi:hypothetical protein